MNNRRLIRALGIGLLAMSVSTTPGCNGTFADSVTCVNVPVLSSISPTSARAHGVGFVMVLTGQKFDSNSHVFFDQHQLATTFISGTELRALVTPELLRNVGTVAVDVFESSAVDSQCQTGSDSNRLPFTIAD